MQVIRENFNFLFTTDGRYSRPKIIGDTVRICVKELGLMKGHPARTDPGRNLVYIPRCHFVFDQVSSSVRTLSPYIGNPKLGTFAKGYREQDGPFSQNNDAKEYAFEGVLEEPLAWIDWVVRAGSFALEIL
jgi:hypothetical protein